MDLRPLRDKVAFWIATLARDLRGFTAASEREVLTDVNIEPTNLCNANCVFCGYQYQERPHTAMKEELGLSIIAAAKRAGVGRLGLTPMVGEPLVHRRLEEFIRAAVAPPRPLATYVTTNGILLSLDRYRSLKSAGISGISVSLSYPEEAEYRRIFRSAKLGTLVKNLEAILEVYVPGEMSVELGVRTSRRHGWDDHALFRRAREKGWAVQRNFFFDDWSGRTADQLEAEYLAVRPNRAKWLPCAMTYSGPHFLSDGRSTICGCRDLDGKSDLALDSRLLIDDMRATYETGAVEAMRARFRRGDAPDICQSCRHYTPTWEGSPTRLRLKQVSADARQAVKSVAEQIAVTIKRERTQ
jgi:hypothetical protein